MQVSSVADSMCLYVCLNAISVELVIRYCFVTVRSIFGTSDPVREHVRSWLHQSSRHLEKSQQSGSSQPLRMREMSSKYTPSCIHRAFCSTSRPSGFRPRQNEGTLWRQHCVLRCCPSVAKWGNIVARRADTRNVPEDFQKLFMCPEHKICVGHECCRVAKWVNSWENGIHDHVSNVASTLCPHFAGPLVLSRRFPLSVCSFCPIVAVNPTLESPHHTDSGLPKRTRWSDALLLLFRQPTGISETSYTLAYHTIPYHIPYYTIPYHTIPYTISYHTIPYHTIPNHTIPYHTIRTVTCHTIPYVPYRTVLCCTIIACGPFFNKFDNSVFPFFHRRNTSLKMIKVMRTATRVTGTVLKMLSIQFLTSSYRQFLSPAARNTSVPSARNSCGHYVTWSASLTLWLASSKSTFSQPFKEKWVWCGENW